MDLRLADIYQIAAEQGVDKHTLDEALSEAFLLAYRKSPRASRHARVYIDADAGTLSILARDPVVVQDEPIEGQVEGQEPTTHVELSEEYDDTPKEFGRLAASMARQVITKLFREMEDERIFGSFKGQCGNIVTGVIQQDSRDTENVHVAVGNVEAVLPRREQVPTERYVHGERLRVYVLKVDRVEKEPGVIRPEIVVSRTHVDLVKRLFEREVPELTTGAVSIMSITREAGSRTKIAVRSHDENVSPQGSLIGPNGSRVRAVMEAINGEKIDIIRWSSDPAEYIAAALSPARVKAVRIIDPSSKMALAFISPKELSLAIGVEGQNARLAARLTGWKIGVQSVEYINDFDRDQPVEQRWDSPELIARRKHSNPDGVFTSSENVEDKN